MQANQDLSGPIMQGLVMLTVLLCGAMRLYHVMYTHVMIGFVYMMLNDMTTISNQFSRNVPLGNFISDALVPHVLAS